MFFSAFPHHFRVFRTKSAEKITAFLNRGNSRKNAEISFQKRGNSSKSLANQGLLEFKIRGNGFRAFLVVSGITYKRRHTFVT